MSDLVIQLFVDGAKVRALWLILHHNLSIHLAAGSLIVVTLLSNTTKQQAGWARFPALGEVPLKALCFTLLVAITELETPSDYCSRGSSQP
jgi:hypothetical protein